MSERAEPSASVRRCVRCLRVIPRGPGTEAIAETLPGGVTLYTYGVLTVKGGHVEYCKRCSPTVIVCRGCGCTDEAACIGGCSWIVPGVCSNCGHLLREGKAA